MSAKYKLKDKKISIWRSTTKKVNGVNTKVWNPIIEAKIWAHYRQTGGSLKLSESNGLYLYNDNELASFIINNRSDVKPLAADIIRYNDKFYLITVVDDFDGNNSELKLTVELATDQSIEKYNGMYDL